MYKKICGGALALGGLLSLIGVIVSFVTNGSVKMLFDDAFNATIGAAIFTRIAAILTFVAAFALIAVVFRDPSSKKRAAIVGGVFAVVGFIGQILINPLTNSGDLADVMMYRKPIAGSAIGLLMIGAASVATLICGIISLAAKNRNMTH